MKPILKLYIKAFLIMGLMYASLMAITGYIDGESFSIFKFLFHAIFFGGTMSLTLVSIYKSNLNDKGITNPSEENLKSVQQTEFISKVSRDEFISRLSKDKVMSRMKLKTNEGTLKLNSGVTWKSWGETIAIKISSASEGMFKYQIQSKPKLPITIIDFGKNLENILMIKKLVKNAD
tara:strand:+ start:385 stop:915 length:531 start_codon:yes stop_codon:yes gene_type:complete